MDRNKFYLKVGDSNAEGYLNDDGSFKVLARALVAPVKTMKGYRKLREQLEMNGVIGAGVFMVDYTFRNHSAATSVVRGSSTANSTLWMTADGYSLKKALEEIPQ